MPSANLSRSGGRKFFSIEFRHPVRKDRAGRFGLKVRRGLNTDNEKEAQKLLTQMNELLADESLHSASARDRAAERFSAVVVEAFYRDLEPVALSRADERNKHLPLPTADDGYSSALLIGTTASGKSTLVRQILGTHPVAERFPSTAPGRTTVADQEFILRPNGDYEAVITFLPRDLIIAKVEDAAADAALAHIEGRKAEQVARALLSPREGRFRLSYVIGSARDLKSDDTTDVDIDEDEESNVEETPVHVRPSRVREFVDRLNKIADESLRLVAETRGVELAKVLETNDRESVEQDIDMTLRDSTEFSDLVADIADEIELRLDDVKVGEFERRPNDWPTLWRIRIEGDRPEDRASFLEALRPFTGISATYHGSLLTPLVEGLRVAGPFRPAWASDNDELRLVLIDGEGVGHNPETLRSLPGSVTDRIASVDRVLLVDSAIHPMLEGPMLVARTVERMGASEKLHFCFTHVDEMRRAENLPTVTDKAAHIRDAAREVLHHLAREFGRNRLPELERAVEQRAFFVAGIDKVIKDGARFTRNQLVGLVDALRHSIPKPSDSTAPEYDLDNLVIATAAAAAEYVETYRALLRLPSPRTVSPIPWQTAKAATRYTSQYGFDGYGSFRPAADFVAMLGERLARFLSSPIGFDPENCTDEAKEAATALVRQALAKRLDPWVRQLLIEKPQTLWVRAYDHRGPGSTRLRAFDIDVLNLAAVPLSSEEGDPESTRFRSEVKQLVVDAIREGGGRIHGVQFVDAEATAAA